MRPTTCAAIVILVSLTSAQAAEPAPNSLPDSDTAISAMIAANGGKLPRTGEDLWRAARKVGRFTQLPIPFSAVRLNSGLNAPRVVLAASGGPNDPNSVSVDARLFLAANMERTEGGDPRVTSVEFISWNGSRRAFDFGLIEGMGGAEEPQLRIVEGGKCFSCHKNRGPILGVRPWSNTTADDVLRYAEASLFKLSGTKLPLTGDFAFPKELASRRDRVDGMALAMPEAPETEAIVRRGASLRTDRALFRSLSRTPEGRKALEIMLVAIAEPGRLDADAKVSRAIDDAFTGQLPKHVAEWKELKLAEKSSRLFDMDPTRMVLAAGVRSQKGLYAINPQGTLVPGLPGGIVSTWTIPTPPAQRAMAGLASPDPQVRLAAAKALGEIQANQSFSATLNEIAQYESARSRGSHGTVSAVQPSNPRAFVPPVFANPRRASEVVNPQLLAATIGLSEGDRRFLSRLLVDSVKRISGARPTTAALAKQAFGSEAFAEFFAGGPLPDRDEFKDRFVEGLDDVLKARYKLTTSFAPERRTYASGSRYNPKAVEEKEAAIVPTTACLRCHDVSASGKASRFDLIPPLAFDPFDKPGRAAWLKSADPKKRQQVLTRMLERMSTDADMPPEDAPEQEFRTKDSAAFAEATEYLTAEFKRLHEKR